MARGTQVRIEGLRDLEKALGELPRATGKNVLRRVGRQRLEPMAADAAQRAPELNRDLKESIAVSTKAAGYARRTGRRQSDVEVYMGPGGVGGKAPPHGHLQEFGTKHHGPQPFMRPAWDAGKDALVDGIADDLKSEIDRAAARAARKQARLIARSGG